MPSKLYKTISKEDEKKIYQPKCFEKININGNIFYIDNSGTIINQNIKLVGFKLQPVPTLFGNL